MLGALFIAYLGYGYVRFLQELHFWEPSPNYPQSAMLGVALFALLFGPAIELCDKIISALS